MGFFQDPNIVLSGGKVPDVILYRICMSPERFYVLFGFVVVVCTIGGVIIGIWAHNRYMKNHIAAEGLSSDEQSED